MKKYMNRVEKIESKSGVNNHNEEWLAFINTDGTVKLTMISVPNPQDTKKELTASEYEAFKQGVDNDNVIEVEWYL